MKKLGFGFMRLPLLDANEVTSIDYSVLNQMVDNFLAQGFTYFDTAYMYHNGVSEVAIREALVSRYPRESFILADKLPTMMLASKEAQGEIFQQQLERCGVKYFDNYLLHNLGAENYQTALKFDSFSFIKSLQDAGKVKRIGFSYHDNAELLEQILSRHQEIEFVQLQINYLDWEDESIQSRKCYEVVKKHGKALIIMEPLKGGFLAKVPAEVESLFKAAAPECSAASWGIRYAASLAEAEVVLSGMSDLAQLNDNLDYMKNFKPLSPQEYEIVQQAKEIISQAIAIPCTACQYCVETCPQKIAIPKYFALYNTEKYNPDFSVLPKVYYNNYIKQYGKASDCIGCKMCEGYCPQQLEIVSLLKEVAAAFEE